MSYNKLPTNVACMLYIAMHITYMSYTWGNLAKVWPTWYIRGCLLKICTPFGWLGGQNVWGLVGKTTYRSHWKFTVAKNGGGGSWELRGSTVDAPKCVVSQPTISYPPTDANKAIAPTWLWWCFSNVQQEPVMWGSSNPQFAVELGSGVLFPHSSTCRCCQNQIIQ